MLNDFIEALKNDTSYDFIANNYYKMDKNDLKDIILELLYEVYYSERTNDNFDVDRVIENLIERNAD